MILAIVLIGFLIDDYQDQTRGHVSRFNASFKENAVVPYFVRKKGGSPYSGVVYGTYFGGRFLDPKEWKGTFINGEPVGEFKHFDLDGRIKSQWSFDNKTSILSPDKIP